MGYDFGVVYQSLKPNVVADAMSRRSYPNNDFDIGKEFEDMLMTIGQTIEEPVPRRRTKSKTVLIELEYGTGQQ